MRAGAGQSPCRGDLAGSRVVSDEKRSHLGLRERPAQPCGNYVVVKGVRLVICEWCARTRIAYGFGRADMNTNNDHSTTIREPAPARGAVAGDCPCCCGLVTFRSPRRSLASDGPVTIGRGRTTGRRAPERRTRKSYYIPTERSRGRTCASRRRRAGWTVEDLGSKNGTFVDGRRIETPTPLSDGSIVLFGSHAAVFRRRPTRSSRPSSRRRRSRSGRSRRCRRRSRRRCRGLRRLATGATTSCSSARRASARRSTRAPFTRRRAGRASSSRSTARRCRRELVESELFGYARGAHSTATRAKPGLVEMADKGTLLLDEIGEMAPRAAGEAVSLPPGRPGAAARVDAHASASIVRVIAARPARRRSVRARGSGRAAGRGADRDSAAARSGRGHRRAGGALAAAAAPPRRLEPAAFRALCLHDWPRNVRELDEVVKRAVALADGRKIRVEDLPGGVRESLEAGPRIRAARKWRAAPSRIELERLLREHRGNVSGVAKALDRQWAVVHRWLRQHDLNADQFRAERAAAWATAVSPKAAPTTRAGRTWRRSGRTSSRRCRSGTGWCWRGATRSRRSSGAADRAWSCARTIAI